MYRFHPRIQRIKELIGSGEIGQLRAIHGVFSFPHSGNMDDIRFRADWGGGGLYDICCYPLSAGRLFTGMEPEAVTVYAQFSPSHGGVDMMASGLVEFPGGIGLTFDGGMWAASRQRLEVVGSTGRIVLEYPFLPGADNDDFLVITANGQRREGPFGINAYVRQADQFARTVRGIEPPAFPAEDAVKGMKLLETCLLSAQRRERIKINA